MKDSNMIMETSLMRNVGCAFIGICVVWFSVQICGHFFAKWKSKSRTRGSHHHVKVECWFCRAVTLVPPGNKNSFDCPECEQYNGFSEDGHYNKPIPAQYSEELNHVHSKPERYHDDKPNLLCHVCQINQELKIQQLAAFIPTNEDRFDEEVEEYSQYLEGAYRLCPACEIKINGELHRQDSNIQSKLLGQRLNQAIMMNTMGASHFRRNSKTIPMLRLLALLAATLVLAAESGPLLDAFGAETLEEGILINVCAFMSSIKTHRTSMCLLGLVCGIFSSFLAGKYRLKYLDCACPLLWMLYMGLVYPSSLHWVLEVVLPVGVATNLPLLLSAVLLVACFGHALQARVKPTKKVFANRLPRNLTEFNPHQCQVASSPERHLESHLEPSAAPSTQTDASMSLSHSSSSESGEIRRILLDQSLLGGLSLGPPTGNKPRNKDIWTAHTPPTSRPATPAMSEDRPSSREFRPVISPATFNPSGLKRCSSQNSFATSFAGAFSACAQFEPQPLPLPQEQREPFMFTDSGRGSCVPSLRDDSSDESFPLGMTAKDHINQTTTTSPHTKLRPRLSGWLPFILPCAFGFSLGINFAAAMYVMYGR